MRKTLAFIIALVLTFGSASLYASPAAIAEGDSGEYELLLPPPSTGGGMSVEEALGSRRSRRNYADTPIAIEQLSQILWAAYGMSEPNRRTAPSAGALYSLVLYASIGDVEGMEPGIYRYESERHALIRIAEGDAREALALAAQRSVVDAPATLLYGFDYDKALESYGEEDLKYVYMEAGHSAQNVYLQAESLGLGTCAIAGFVEYYTREAFALPAGEVPLYLMPIGHSLG